MITIQQIITELIYPILDLLAVLLRGLGALGIGFVVGRALRYTLVYKFRMRFYVPLIFLGMTILAWVIFTAGWSSPGTAGMFGIGIFAGYAMMKGGESEEQTFIEVDEADEE